MLESDGQSMGQDFLIGTTIMLARDQRERQG
jgi:hypothetical protein